MSLPVMWSDEFDGPQGQPPSPRSWRHETGGGGWGDQQAQEYTDAVANAQLTGEGCLAITARSEPVDPEAAAGQIRITSARLTTQGLVAARFGRVAARIRVPLGTGLWPAFWMLGTDIDTAGWPGCGEIDVVEHVGSEPTTVHGTVHGPGFAGVGHGLSRAHDTGVVLAEDFHVFAVDWQPQQITWSVDETEYHRITPSDLPASRWLFDHDFYVLVNLAVGGGWPGNEICDPAAFAKAVLPATMLVDWVRIHSAA
jgi:beta-glucanase (GH16 family)